VKVYADREAVEAHHRFFAAASPASESASSRLLLGLLASVRDGTDMPDMQRQAESTIA
jgi:hypothetical protein